MGSLRPVSDRFERRGHRDQVFQYIEREDTPRSLTYQMRLLGQAGFQPVEVLHKHACFAAFGGVKPGK